MINFKAPSINLYVAIKADGTIVNDNDIRHLGPVFSLGDTKVRVDENGETAEKYALHIDDNGGKQGAFDILGCKLISAMDLAKTYCTKHNIDVASKKWIERSNWRNTYEVVDANGTEYHFHLSREYEPNGNHICWEWVYVSTENKDGKIAVGRNITNIRDI